MNKRNLRPMINVTLQHLTSNPIIPNRHIMILTNRNVSSMPTVPSLNRQHPATCLSIHNRHSSLMIDTIHIKLPRDQVDRLNIPQTRRIRHPPYRSQLTLLLQIHITKADDNEMDENLLRAKPSSISRQIPIQMRTMPIRLTRRTISPAKYMAATGLANTTTRTAYLRLQYPLRLLIVTGSECLKRGTAKGYQTDHNRILGGSQR